MSCTVFAIKVLASKHVGCRCNIAKSKGDITLLRISFDKGRVLITSGSSVDSYLVSSARCHL